MALSMGAVQSHSLKFLAFSTTPYRQLECLRDPCFKLFYAPAAHACPSRLDRRDGALSAANLRANAAYNSDLRSRVVGGAPCK